MASYHTLDRETFNRFESAAGWKPFPNVSMERLAKCMVSRPWSPNEWTGGRRAKGNFIRSDYLGLDFDNGETSLEAAVKLFCDCRHVIGTTRNHQKEKNGITVDRFRVVIPWETAITDRLNYEYNMRLASDRYSIDESTLDAARFFYPCNEIVSISEDGYLEEVKPTSREWLRERDRAEANRLLYLKFAAQQYRDYGKLPKDIMAFKNSGKLIGSGRNDTGYVIALKLAFMGWTEAEAYEFLLSCNYEKSWDFKPEKEFRTAVKSAFKYAFKDMNFKLER